ncbi:MAG: hypothetical protein GY708_25210 [Actinomycetia bacterium]|nr:hypothetical protein [Actinomycetes bacterium]MCP4961818.1 hypothetical protein [Actinomycetes bacterium]
MGRPSGSLASQRGRLGFGRFEGIVFTAALCHCSALPVAVADLGADLRCDKASKDTVEAPVAFLDESVGLAPRCATGLVSESIKQGR